MDNPTSPLETLRQLKEMLDAGALTPTEFEALKQRLLFTDPPTPPAPPPPSPPRRPRLVRPSPLFRQHPCHPLFQPRRPFSHPRRPSASSIPW
ncbi:SHOCT domain-containing protein [Hymenobacter lapidarius]|uniref:SHOCT domain-containing protein n=1 Tax=Hymenobacter lapidarius TaxID=1908237 RepID=UPI0009F1D96A|nr:SHOCT domain-containing protein [Hymenobacter lapidarius]